MTSNRPPSASARSRMPISPSPLPSAARSLSTAPHPSSSIVNASQPRSHVVCSGAFGPKSRATRARLAFACLLMLVRPSIGLDVLDALARILDVVNDGVPIGEPRRRIGVRVDAKELDLEVPADEIGEVLVGLSQLAIGIVKRKRRGNQETDEGDGDNAQCQ